MTRDQKRKASFSYAVAVGSCFLGLWLLESTDNLVLGLAVIFGGAVAAAWIMRP